MILSRQTLDRMSELAVQAQNGHYDEQSIVNTLKGVDERYYSKTSFESKDDVFEGLKIRKKSILVFSTYKNWWFPLSTLERQDKADAVQQIWNNMNIQLTKEINENL